MSKGCVASFSNRRRRIANEPLINSDNSPSHQVMDTGEKHCFEDRHVTVTASLRYKFVVVRQGGRISQLLAQHLLLSKALVGEHKALSFL
jgi:hypothetical protein